MGEFFANSILGSAIKVFAGVVLASFVTYLVKGGTTAEVSWSDVIVWVDAALVVAVPLLINILNPKDTRYGRGSGGS